MRTFIEEDFADYEDEDPFWCPVCKERGYLNRIGRKMLMPGDEKPDNYEELVGVPCLSSKWRHRTIAKRGNSNKYS